MANRTMRHIREGEVPFDGGTAIQEDIDRPVFHGNGPDDYLCVRCGNRLAERMNPAQMTYKVRVRCGRCDTVNVAVTESEADAPPSLDTVQRDVVIEPGMSRASTHLRSGCRGDFTDDPRPR
ncbi:MAG: hypothetical protein ACR2QA_10655 [Solirubrobacteraceae bacterium]